MNIISFILLALLISSSVVHASIKPEVKKANVDAINMVIQKKYRLIQELRTKQSSEYEKAGLTITTLQKEISKLHSQVMVIEALPIRK